ncbi:MAG: urease accessory protein UreD [Pseudohongiella sp.]
MPSSNWVANLNLNFRCIDGHSRLINPSHSGPLRVQRPFYPEGKSLAHLYLLHPPGGVVGGDRLQIDTLVSENSQSLITTPGATKIYRSDSKRAYIDQNISLENCATLEWLPQETIIFDGAFADSTTRINLGQDSKFIAWEIICFGRPGANELFEHGDVRMNLEIWRSGLPVWLDRGVFSTESKFGSKFHSAWGLNSFPVMATMVAAPCNQQMIDSLSEQNLLKGSYTISLVEDLWGCRDIGAGTQGAKSCFVEIWSQLRPGLLNRPPCPPRVWST